MDTSAVQSGLTTETEWEKCDRCCGRATNLAIKHSYQGDFKLVLCDHHTHTTQKLLEDKGFYLSPLFI